MKRNRSQYRRIWTAAARTIQNHDDQPSNARNCNPLVCTCLSSQLTTD